MTTVNNRKVSPPSGKDEDQRETGFLNRPRTGGKSFWDWLNLIGLLLIPLVVGAATIGFGLLQLDLANIQHQQDQQRALDQQQATILQTYIDNIQDLLLNHHLLEANEYDPSNPYYDVATLARARTLTALQGLDPERKGLLVEFLYEAKLIGFQDNNNKTHYPVIILYQADLRDAYFRDAYLSGAYLYSAYLSGAYLTWADLSSANLRCAIFNNAHLNNAKLDGAHLDTCSIPQPGIVPYHLGADLRGADLRGATLRGADLNGATLVGANLIGADLSSANLYGTDLSSAIITQQQLDQVDSCSEAILPPGLTCHHNQ